MLIMRATTLLVILMFSMTINAGQPKKQHKIVVSTTSVASIVAMLVGEEIEIAILANNNGCPHHHSSSPSELKNVQDADLAIYISKEFDVFAKKLIEQHLPIKNASKVIKFSDFPALNLLKYDNSEKDINWHLWLDLYNVNVILEELAKRFIAEFPELKVNIKHNLIIAKEKILSLRSLQAEIMSVLPNVILLSDSLEYFFLGTDKKTRLYTPSHKSLKYMYNLQQLISNSQSTCIVISTEQNPNLYKDLPVRVIQLESENWFLEHTDNLNDLFYNKYMQMVNKLSQCLPAK